MVADVMVAAVAASQSSLRREMAGTRISSLMVIPRLNVRAPGDEATRHQQLQQVNLTSAKRVALN